MPVKVDWYKDTKHISFIFNGKWSWEELFEAIDEVVRRLDTVGEPVFLVIDVNNTGFVPTYSYHNLKRVATAPTMSHPNTQKLLMIGANRYVELMVNVFKKAFPDAGGRYLLFKTFEEMDSYLKEVQQESS